MQRVHDRPHGLLRDVADVRRLDDCEVDPDGDSLVARPDPRACSRHAAEPEKRLFQSQPQGVGRDDRRRASLLDAQLLDVVVRGQLEDDPEQRQDGERKGAEGDHQLAGGTVAVVHELDDVREGVDRLCRCRPGQEDDDGHRHDRRSGEDDDEVAVQFVHGSAGTPYTPSPSSRWRWVAVMRFARSESLAA